jgi:hypothetical protein
MEPPPPGALGSPTLLTLRAAPTAAKRQEA